MGQLIDDLTRLRAEGGQRNEASRYLDGMGFSVEESRRLSNHMENFSTGEIASGLSERETAVVQAAMNHAIRGKRPDSVIQQAPTPIEADPVAPPIRSITNSIFSR